MSLASRIPASEFSVKRLTDLALSTLAIYVLSLALPIMTLQVYDRVLPAGGSGTLAMLTIGVLVALVLEIVLRLMRAYMIGWSGAAFEHQVASSAIEHLLSADLSRLPHQGVAGSLHRLGSVGQLKDIYSGQAFTTFLEIGFLFVFLGLIAYIAGYLVLVPICVIACLSPFVALSGMHLNGKLKARGDTDDERFDFLIEALHGVHSIKSMALEKLFLRRYEVLEAVSCCANHAVSRTNAHLVNLGSFASHAMIASVVSVGAVMVINRSLSVGALIASLLLSGRLMQPVQKALYLWVQYQNFRLNEDRAASLFAPRRIAPSGSDQIHAAKHGELTLKDVGFGFAEDQWIFRHVDLNLRPGEVISLSGAQGAGKSVLLKVIAGVYPASEGSVLIDGSSAIDFEPKEIMNRVGLISTEGAIFRGTIRDNITRFGLVPEAQALKVAKLLGIDQDLAGLADGFGTRLEGNLADTIPPGLKQRVAIARALALKPRVVLFDNADRGIDQHGYNLLYRMLGSIRAHTTLVLVTEDRNLLGLATRHLILGPNGLAEGMPMQVCQYNVQSYRELRI